MNKMTIEITRKGYTRTLVLNGKTYKDEMLKTDTGAKENGPSIEYQLEKDGVYDKLDRAADDFYMAIEGNDPYDLMKEFAEIHDYVN